MARTLPLLGKLLCWLGFHDFHVVGKSFVEFNVGVENKNDEARDSAGATTEDTQPRSHAQMNPGYSAFLRHR